VVKVPHEMMSYYIVLKEGGTLGDVSGTNEVLRDNIEWACGCNAACSTCHVIVDPAYYPLLDPPDDDELDMLDLAWGVTDTSRLACQMKITPKCNGMKIAIPRHANNVF
jgi:ferredoxin